MPPAAHSWLSHPPMAARRLRLWWRRAAGKEKAAAAAAFGIVLFSLLFILSPLLFDGYGGRWVRLGGSSSLVELTLLRDAERKGAVCLDGSPPGYHLQRGFGSGSSNWVVHLEGGGWCSSVESCSKRKSTKLGSSRYMEPEVYFDGILSNEKALNPDFFNWNKVKVRYCDGGSFSGYIESSVQNATTLYFRGQRIWEVIMEELLSKGLANAKQALLTGCSAGGLATFIHCDNFRKLLPDVSVVKCFADGGYFLNSKDVSGSSAIKSFYNDVVHLQDLRKNLRKECTLRKEPSQCLFPQEMTKFINTPFFILNPAYDWWQIQNILAPELSDPNHLWLQCKLNIKECDPQQIEVLQRYRNTLLRSLKDFQHRKGAGMLITSCFVHCQTTSNSTWHSPTSPRINNKTIAEAVGDWYFGRKTVKIIDCPYPCNPTCHHQQFLKLVV